MRVFLTTVGSRGDVDPFIALAAGLQTRGHNVTLSTADRFADLAATHDVPFAPTTSALLDLIELPVGRELLESLTSPADFVRQFGAIRELARRAGPIHKDLIDASWAAAQAAEPDVVIAHPKAFWGNDFAAVLGARPVRAVLQPMLAPTGETPALGFPALPLGPAYNRLTYRIVEAGIEASARRYLRDWRRVHGRVSLDAPPLMLHGYSAHVVPEPADWPSWAAVTGYWFLDKAASLAPEIEAFLDAGDPPVYVGFGSMASRDPEATTAVVAEAVRAAGVRALFATGWDGLRADDLGGDVLVIEGAPHEALFPRCTAVVHHGGAGTTAAGLRAGRPTVVVAHFGDQPFWGRRVHALGAGPAPILKKRLTAGALAAAIREAVTSDAIRQRAAALGAAIREEDGVGNAVRLIEAVAST